MLPVSTRLLLGGYSHVVSRAASLPELDSFRPVPGAKKFRRAVQQGPHIPGCQGISNSGCHRKDLLCGRLGMHLVLERGALPAAVGGYDMSSQTIRCTCAHGDRRAAHTLQVACMG